MNLLKNLPMKINYIKELILGYINRIYYNNIYNNCSIGKNLRVASKTNFSFWGNYHVTLGEKIYLRNYVRIQIENGRLDIGNNTFFNNFCSINCLDKITIGNDCLFGENVKIYDHNHVFKDFNIPIKNQGYKTSPINIGNNCWIGSNVIILKGVIIGDNVVIGANCIIKENIESNSIIENKTLHTISERLK